MLEWSALALHHMKPYLQTCMTQTQQNNAMVLYILTLLTNYTTHVKVMNKFASRNEDWQMQLSKF